MSWVGIANNQTVSFSNLQDAVDNGIFILKSAITSSSEQITKADADAKVYIDTSYSPYSSKTSSQLVVKSDLRGGFLLYGQSLGCVVPETDILIAPDVTRKADTFSVGDIVYTKHEDTELWGYYKIEALERKEQPILNILTDRGDIRCSTTHLLFRRGEYVKAEELIVGDMISHIEGDAIITDIVSEEVSTVIEFNIDDAHTYVAAGFIAHNKCTLNGWDDCVDACTNGVTAYSTAIYYTGALTVGTDITSPSCFLGYPAFYYYPGGYLEIDFTGSDYEVISLGTCPCTTTTTTTTIFYYYYNVDQHDCGNSCAYVQSFVAISTTVLIVNRFYKIAGGYVYKVISSGSAPDDGIDLTGAPSNTNCNIACTL